MGRHLALIAVLLLASLYDRGAPWPNLSSIFPVWTATRGRLRGGRLPRPIGRCGEDDRRRRHRHPIRCLRVAAAGEASSRSARWWLKKSPSAGRTRGQGFHSMRAPRSHAGTATATGRLAMLKLSDDEMDAILRAAGPIDVEPPRRLFAGGRRCTGQSSWRGRSWRRASSLRRGTTPAFRSARFQSCGQRVEVSLIRHGGP